MRIGLMLRAIDEKGGIGVYANNVLQELLELDSTNDYVLFYRSREHLGRFASRPNVTERYVWGPNKAFWDQIAIPWACAREKVDVVFHPKFTVPFLAPSKAVMVVHGADWFMPDQARFYGDWDVRYIRTVMPLYFRRASVVISVSHLTTANFQKVLDLPPGKIRTVYFGPARHFARVQDQRKLAEVRERYALPDRFILTLTKLGDGNRKNFAGMLEGYSRYHQRDPRPLPLVVGGKDCDRLRDQYRIPEGGYGGDVHFPGWIDQKDLPSIYSLAELFLYASNLEAFPIPLTEAMACGTAIVTSSVNGLEELAGNAALLVDPASPDEIADALARVTGDPGLRERLSRTARQRSALFSWDKCARETLAILEELGEQKAS